VFRGKTVSGPGEMFAGTPAEPIKDYLKSMAKVRRLK
jgi:UDP-3-O-[3-hydroxymyristoyl] glucosamine N-acyltransferase